MEEINLFNEMEEAILIEYGFRVDYTGAGDRFFYNDNLQIFRSIIHSHLFLISFKKEYLTFEEVLNHIKDKDESKD